MCMIIDKEETAQKDITVYSIKRIIRGNIRSVVYSDFTWKLGKLYSLTDEEELYTQQTQQGALITVLYGNAFHCSRNLNTLISSCKNDKWGSGPDFIKINKLLVVKGTIPKGNTFYTGWNYKTSRYLDGKRCIGTRNIIFNSIVYRNTEAY